MRENHWLGLKLIGKKANIDSVGAVITYQAGDLKRSHMKVGGGSYLSFRDPRVVLGLGQRTKIDWGRDQVALAQRAGRASDRTSPRPLHHDSRRPGEMGINAE